MADDNDQMTVRERRAERAKATARKEAPARLARKAIVPAIVLLVVAGIGAGFYFTNKAQGECPGHWHSSFDVYVKEGNETRRMAFTPFDLNSRGEASMPPRMHMHQSDRITQFHYEPVPSECISLKEAMGYVDVELAGTSMKFTGAHAQVDQEATYRDNATNDLRVFVQYVSDRQSEARGNQEVVVAAKTEWKETSLKSVIGYQMKDGERFLILSGSFSDEEIAQFQEALPAPTGYDISAYG